MSILIKPTKIKKGFYLLIPKLIADLTKVKDSTKFTLEIKNGRHGKKIIQYVEKQDKPKRKKIRKKSKRRSKKRRYKK